MRKPYSISTLACLPLLACGSDGTHHIITPDGPPADTAPEVCHASASYASAVGQNETNYAAGVLGSAAGHEEDVDMKLNADPAYDILHLWMYDGYGGFGSGVVRNGTYPLAGDDISGFANCGLCLFIDTDFDGSNIADTYFATAGSITISSAGTNGSGTLSGTISSVTLKKVTIDQTSGAVTPTGNCSTTIASLPFSGALAVGSAFQNTGWTSPTSPHRALSLVHRYR